MRTNYFKRNVSEYDMLHLIHNVWFIEKRNYIIPYSTIQIGTGRYINHQQLMYLYSLAHKAYMKNGYGV